MNTNNNQSNANGREENGENREHKEQARAHLEALAETDLPYAPYAKRVLQTLDSEGAGDRNE